MPHTPSDWPETARPSGETRNTTMAATSCGGHHPAQRDLVQVLALHLLVGEAELLGAGADHPLDARPLDDARAGSR